MWLWSDFYSNYVANKRQRNKETSVVELYIFICKLLVLNMKQGLNLFSSVCISTGMLSVYAGI